MEYLATYNELVRQLLGREFKDSDGVPASELTDAERRLGFRLPGAVRCYYEAAGRLTELNQAHNQLLLLNEIEQEGEFVVFMVENQAVVYWGFKRLDPSPDPVVWQRVNETDAEWYSEEKTFSQFIVSVFRWQAGFDEDT